MKRTSIFTIICSFLFLQLIHCSELIIIDIAEPNDFSNTRILGLAPAFGPNIPSEKYNNQQITIQLAEPINGCSTKPTNNNNNNHPKLISNSALLIQRGECNFTDKVLFAQNLGYNYAIIINNQPEYPYSTYEMTIPDQFNAELIHIPSFMISYNDGQLFTNNNNNNKISSFLINLHRYEKNRFDASFLIMLFLALLIVYSTAYFSAQKERQKYYQQIEFSSLQLNNNNNNSAMNLFDSQPIQYIDSRTAIAFIFVASAGLLLLFYFLNKLIYILLLLFMLGSIQAMTLLFSLFLHTYFPQFNRRLYILSTTLDFYTAFSFLLSLIISIIWLFIRKNYSSWLLQDLMCISLLFLIQKTIRLPNIKVSTLLLSLAFFYDIFWVFFSEYLFGSSVMMNVATGGNTGENVPMLIKLPRLNDELFGFSMLGLGDIALPGLFISFLLRFDYYYQLQGIRGYFYISLFGYSIGLVFTYLALILTKHGQPALLYLVPCTLGVIIILAIKRKEFTLLWNGMEHETREAERNHNNNNRNRNNNNASNRSNNNNNTTSRNVAYSSVNTQEIHHEQSNTKDSTAIEEEGDGEYRI